MIVKDSEGFRELMGFIEPGYRIPSRKTLTNRLEQQFAEKKAVLKRKLATVDVALTTDCWTALTTESYIQTLQDFAFAPIHANSTIPR